MLTTVELFILSAALGTDLFSIAVPIGMSRVRLRLILRSAAVFSLFHIIMLLAGYHAGHWLGHMVEHVGVYHIDWPVATVQNWASALGAVVLAGLGIRMIKENLFCKSEENLARHPLKGFPFVMLAASVSIDALAAGFSLGMMDVDLIQLSIILGTVIFAIAIAGLAVGRRVGRCVGSRAELIGGLVLLMLGAHLLWTTLA